MKIEKAIEVLKMDNELMQFDPNTGEDYPIELQNEINQDIYRANLIAISALEKQIPEKVIVISSLETYCPCCDNEVINNYYYFSYCEKCGQKIDWSEVENEC